MGKREECASRARVSVAGIAVLLLVGFVVNSGAWAGENAESVKPFVVISGADSHVTKPSLAAIQVDEQWQRVWAQHLGTTVDDAYRAAMEVDFDRCMVVAVFRGSTRNVRGVTIDSVSAMGASTRIRLNDVGYQTGGKSSERPLDRPYAFIVLPKSAKHVVVEENVQQYKGEPPVWKEWRRTEGRKDRKRAAE